MNNETAAGEENAEKKEDELRDDDLDEEAGEHVPLEKRTPMEPNAGDIARHRITHTPYRSWCPECVRGRAKADPHKDRSKEEKREHPTVHMD